MNVSPGFLCLFSCSPSRLSYNPCISCSSCVTIHKDTLSRQHASDNSNSTFTVMSQSHAYNYIQNTLQSSFCYLLYNYKVQIHIINNYIQWQNGSSYNSSISLWGALVSLALCHTATGMPVPSDSDLGVGLKTSGSAWAGVNSKSGTSSTLYLAHSQY